ncbi:OmpA family protein [Fulvivirga sp. M361]|uniref:OmpA family protein n=1 Tax=Fulvivirga sp. M361 TaxID=2594266 RepID=UPI00117A283D|nr:OmpA family protein [Fulvivirga sp. M361]TRX61724.1 OmpA family protein [Fulvivirga sp. M361]
MENLGPTINTEGNELFPFLHNDRDLYFASNGHGGLGGLDIFGIDLTDGFDGRISNVGSPINSALDDFGIILRPDGKTGFFSTNREESLSNDDIYSFTTTQPLIVSYFIKGIVYDKNENTRLSGVPVTLVQNGEIISQIMTDQEGDYSFPVKPNTAYELKSDSTGGYIPSVETVTTLESEKNNIWEKDLFLTKDLDFELLVDIKEKESKEPIDGVKVVVVDNLNGNTIIDQVTNAQGQLLYSMTDKELNDRVSYQIRLSKDGYLGKIETYNGTLDQPGRLDISKFLDLSLDRIEVGADLGKLVDIKPIYFDLGKYNIRPDAAAELDKIVGIMLENPGIEIELGSHTDSRGSASSNARLSDKRAKASADYIVSRGIEKSRIIGKGYGESVLINRCSDGVKCSKEEHQLNRRTEFRVTKVN